MNKPSPAPALLALDHIHVYVADRAAAATWYREVLGLAPVPEFAEWTDERGPLTVGNAANTVHLALFERPLQANRSVIALRVDADAFLAWRTHLAAALGRTVEAVDHALSWSLYFVDPDGNPYEITCYDYAVLRQRL